MKKKLPVGLSDFEEIISEKYYFVDKTLLIKELLDSKAKATLLPRPRRFGKTVNMTMIRHFFEKTEQSKQALFEDLKILQHAECMAKQGQYPVIFLTFKDIKHNDWAACQLTLKMVINAEFVRHDYLLDSVALSESQKKDFSAIIGGSADLTIYQNSLKALSELLFKHHGRKPIILIDEYDTPIIAGHVNKYYKEIVSFMRGFLGGGLKDNNSLEFSVLTGILRVAKESIFSGLNNLEVATIISAAYADKFGLTEEEVLQIVGYYESESRIDEIRAWYDGYQTGGGFNIYNPWSIINFFKSDEVFKAYWVNTSDNAIIRDLIESGSPDLKKDIEVLLAGGTIEKYINESIVFDSIYTQADAVWSFLLFSGYLSFNEVYLKNDMDYATLRLPNTEVRSFYRVVVLDWIKKRGNFSTYEYMLKSLVAGDVSMFKKIFYDFVLASFSYFDASGTAPEQVYHAFVLGMLVSLNSTHQVRSNRESGYGRYDVMVIPHDKSQCGIIIEFKKIDVHEKETLEQAAAAALKQIEEKQYASELRALGVKNIVKLGIAFDGKKVFVENV